jgi:hypothetical protein
MIDPIENAIPYPTPETIHVLGKKRYRRADRIDGSVRHAGRRIPASRRFLAACGERGQSRVY